MVVGPCIDWIRFAPDRGTRGSLMSEYHSLYTSIVKILHPYPVHDSKITGLVFWKDAGRASEMIFH